MDITSSKIFYIRLEEIKIIPESQISLYIPSFLSKIDLLV